LEEEEEQEETASSAEELAVNPTPLESGVPLVTDREGVDLACKATYCFAAVGQIIKLAHLIKRDVCPEKDCQHTPAFHSGFTGSALYLTWVRYPFMYRVI
jgi:hypothetical protein